MMARSSGTREGFGVTAYRVVFDTWAWWEVLGGTARGRDLEGHYLKKGKVRVYTSAISLGELSAKLVARGEVRKIADMAASIRAYSDIIDVTPEIALHAGILREKLRKAEAQASLADALVMATALQHDAMVISEDPAFRDQDSLH